MDYLALLDKAPDEVKRESRRGEADALLWRLSQEIARTAPKGIGHWDAAWAMLAPADDALALAVHHWEARGGDAVWRGVRRAAATALRTWNAAVDRYHREHLPREAA